MSEEGICSDTSQGSFYFDLQLLEVQSFFPREVQADIDLPNVRLTQYRHKVKSEFKVVLYEVFKNTLFLSM